MKTLKTIFFVLVLVSGCRAPDYVTSHGAHVYFDCAESDHDFPTTDEIELVLDHMLENAYKCIPVEAEDLSMILSNMNITLQCDSSGGKHYDNYYRDDIYVDWHGYDRIWTLYHELMHPGYRYYQGGTNRDHSDETYWRGATCLVRLFELFHGWSV